MGRTETAVDSVIGTPEFETEDQARAYIEQRLGPYYRLYPEIQMRHYDGSRQRIDYVALARQKSAHIGGQRCIGIEIKRGYEQGRDFIRSLQQCIDYRHSTIVDKNSQNHQGITPGFIFLFPDFTTDGLYYNDNWRAGLVRLAGRYNVGVVQDEWNYWEKQLITQFEVAGTVVWRSNHGNVGVENFGSRRKRGSQ